jgi:hypothetical protein
MRKAMSRFRWLLIRPLILVVLMILAGQSPQTWAQKQPPPVLPNPTAPVLAMPVPLGIQRGTSLDLVLTGTNLSDPTTVLTSFPATVTIPTENNNGKDAAKLLVKLAVPKDAPLGFHSLRLATTRGVSNLRLFCIDDLPQVMEVDTNRTKATAQAVPVPSVVVGRADAETNDYFKINVQAGQRVSFEILGRRLGSIFDPQITLFDAKTGKELPGGHNNDSPGLQTDPRLTYTFKDAGEYLVEVRDTQYRGGPDYWYRLRIGDFPCATTPIPMAAKRGSKVAVQFAGPTVEGVPPVEVTVPTDPLVDTVWVTPKGTNGLSGWPVALVVSNVDEVVEQEPNNEPAKANRVPVPGGVTGRFLEKSDLDHYVFAAKKGQRLIIEAQTIDWNSPTEVYMVLKDAKGTDLAKSNPATPPSRIDFNPPADGDYTLAVEHLHYWGGPAESYHISITPYEPGFELTLPIERNDIPQGGGAAIIVQAVRRDYTGPIELSLVGPPGLTGQSVIPAGQAAGYLVVNAPADAPLKAATYTIQGKAMIDGKPVVGLANGKTPLSQSLANLLLPPRDLSRHVAVAITEKPPFQLTAKFDHAEVIRGVATNLTITATRTPGFTDAITLNPPQGMPPNVPPIALKAIPKDMIEVKVPFTAPANAPLGEFGLLISGKAKFQNKDYQVPTLPVPLILSLPFDLKVEPMALKAAPGDKAKFKVTAVRKGGYQGPIALQVRNLPANVTAPAATIAMGQNDAEIELTFAANATAGAKADVNILGTASAAANQQNASPNFAITVEKK